MARLWRWTLAVPAIGAGLLILAMVLGITASVTLRATTGAEIPGAVELSEIGLYLSAVLAAPWLLYQGSHIRADLLAPMLPPRGARALDAAADLLGLAVCAALCWISWGVAAQGAALGGLVRRTITYPEWWLAAPLPPVFALLAGEFAARLVRGFLDPSARRVEARSVA